MKKIAPAVLLGVALAGCGGGGSDQPAAATVQKTWTAPAPISPAAPASKEVGVYFGSWLADSNTVKDMDTSGMAASLTYIDYAFGVIYKDKDGYYRCHADLDDLNHNYLDYSIPTDSSKSINGQSDSFDQPIGGSFNQLRLLKLKYPNLKTMISIGGGDAVGGKYFSAASATGALRKELVRSCIDQYIAGNLPVSNLNSYGGNGSGINVFDGIDIDWEYPGIPTFNNTVDVVNDKHNFTLLMQEFRTQLDALGATRSGAHYYLSYAGSVPPNKMQQTEPAALASYIDWVNLMSYEFHAGAWEPNGPTNFQSNLYNDPAAPNIMINGMPVQLSLDSGVQQYLAAGMPASKIAIGIPFFAHGWSGVANGGTHGLYQGASQNLAQDAIPYASLMALPGAVFYNQTTKSVWKYDGNNFWTYDDPTTIGWKVDYIKANNLRGAFGWANYQEDSSATLTKAMAKVAQ